MRGVLFLGPLRKATPVRSRVEASTLRRKGEAAPPKLGSKKYFAASFQLIHASVSPPHSVYVAGRLMMPLIGGGRSPLLHALGCKCLKNSLWVSEYSTSLVSLTTSVVSKRGMAAK